MSAQRLLAPPLAAFLAGRALVWAASGSAGFGYPGAADLTRHDSFLYLAIARHGYTLYPCDRIGGWCGNSGWMPLYSLLIAPFAHLGFSAETVGAVVSASCQLASLVVLWWLVGRGIRGVLVLAAAAVLPGAVYYAAVFPLSLLTLLCLGAVAFMQTGRPRAASAALALAAATYPLGILAAGAAGGYELVSRRTRQGVRYLLAGAAGLGAVAVTQRLWVGHWDAYVLVQRHYRHEGTSPWRTIRYAKEAALTYLHDPHRSDLIPQLQVLLVLAFVVGVAATAVWSRSRHDLFIAAFVVAAWATPFVLGGVSLYRSDAALLPGLLVTRRLPVLVQACFVVAAALLAFEMDRLFFLHRLT